MSRSQRTKGKAGELEIVHAFKYHNWPHARRTGDAGQVDGDITGTDPYHVEVKRRETLDIPGWWRQTIDGCPEADIPLLVFRGNREPWRACLYLHDLLGRELR